MNVIVMKSLFLFLIGLCCIGSGFSQNLKGKAPEDALLFLAGTTYAEGGNHAWLLWQAQDTALLQGRTYAIYRKTGDASSGNSFSRVALVQPTRRSAFLDARIDALPSGLANKAGVNETIDGLFGDVMPKVSLSLGNKMSALLQIASKEKELFNRLYFLSRTEPAVAVAMGTGALVEMPSALSTFEVRMQPNGGNTPGVDFSQVVGRVTLDRNNPASIAAPGPPVVIPDASPKGHLNVALRWGVTDELKRDTPLTYGYGVYRITKAFAEATNVDTTPPTPVQLEGFLTNNAAHAQQVNLLPVLPTELLTLTEAATIPLDEGADPEFRDPYFILDDNQAQLEGNPAFEDGEQFYYYVATLDILGRPAAISEGTLVTMCHRFPPMVPVNVDASSQYSYDNVSQTSSTHLAVTWSAPETTPEPSHYLVYRWESVEQMTSAAGDPATEAGHLISGNIPHVAGTERYEFVDNGAGAPGLPAQAGATFWYSVKAVLATACGDLPSGHGAPDWAVLREWKGPLNPGGEITWVEVCPEIKKVGEVEMVTMTTALAQLFSGNSQNAVPLIFKVEAVDSAIVSAAQIKLLVVDDDVVTGEQFLGQHSYKGEGPSEFSEHRFVPQGAISAQSKVFVEICARLRGGKSVCERFPLAGLNYVVTDPPSAAQLCFQICVVEMVREEGFEVSGGGRGIHSPTAPNGSARPVEFTFTPTPGTGEYKLYERIDAGPLVMIEQGTVAIPGAEVTITDSDHPAHASVVCYFLQYFDQHGNPSPMSLVRCLRFSSRVDLPVPMLAQVEHAGDTANPQGTLRWSCEPNGVERFVIGIGDGISSIEMEYSPDLAPHTVKRLVLASGGGLTTVDVQTSELHNEVKHHDFQTGRVGGNFGNPALPGQYEITLNLKSGREYQFYVKARSADGGLGEVSNLVKFTWTESGPPVGPQVPWPARSLPPIDENFIPEVKAQMIQIDSIAAGPAAMIKIGTVTHVEPNSVVPGRIIYDGGAYLIPTRIPDGNGYSYDVFTTKEGESLLPFALYRYQVPNLYFPTVSGDVAQVAPLLEKLRLHETTEGALDYIEIQDPLITAAIDPDDSEEMGLYLIDSQGVVEGATYVYLLVRFKENGEVDRTIPTNSLFVPLTQE